MGKQETGGSTNPGPGAPAISGQKLHGSQKKAKLPLSNDNGTTKGWTEKRGQQNGVK